MAAAPSQPLEKKRVTAAQVRYAMPHSDWHHDGDDSLGETTMRLMIIGGYLMLVLTFSHAHGDVLVSESFDYDPGSIEEQEGGDGWFDSWLISENLIDTEFHLEVIEPSTPLVYALPDGGFVNGGDRALRFYNADDEAVLANETDALTRGLDEVIDTDVVFFSFLYRYDGDGTDTGGFIDDNDFVVWWFNSAGGPQMGLKGNFGNGSQTEDFVGRVSGAFAPPQQAYAPGIDISEEAGTLNSDWLIVGKMSKAAHSDVEDDYDQFDLWVNPAISDEDAPHATGMGAPSDALAFELESIGLRIFDQEPGDAMIWDELRIGETWMDVVGPIGDQDLSGGVEPLAGDCNGDGQITPADLDCSCNANGDLDAALAALGTVQGDLDGVGGVAFLDFLTLANNFGGENKNYSDGDVDCDGQVAFLDFLALANNFGQGGAAAAAVPEPSSGVLLLSSVLCGLLCLRRFQ